MVLPWLWYRPAAIALIRPLAWELTCVVGVALKGKKKKKSKVVGQLLKAINNKTLKMHFIR